MCAVETDFSNNCILSKKSVLTLPTPTRGSPGRTHQFPQVQSNLNDRSLCLCAIYILAVQAKKDWVQNAHFGPKTPGGLFVPLLNINGLHGISNGLTNQGDVEVSACSVD